MAYDVFILILGLATLIVGGEFLVKGAVGMAQLLKITPLVIGMTVVSFGTSAPELLVSINSAMDGSPGIAVGNVVGSNIANLALVLGVTLLIFPIIPGRQSKRIDWPMMIFATALFIVFAWDGVVHRWEGITLFVILIAFTSWLIVSSRKETKKKVVDSNEELDDPIPAWKSGVFLFIGLVGLYFGSEWLVGGAKSIAAAAGMEEHIIGLTVVAFGTSAPELVASAMAAYRKQTDISLGNLIGSNLFNIMAVLGITSMVKPVDVDPAFQSFDFFWMVAIALAIGPMMYIGSKMTRFNGLMLLVTYIVYITVLVLKAKGCF